MDSCRCLGTRRLAKSLRPTSHAIGSHTLRAEATIPDFLQARRADIEMPVAAVTGGDRRDFLSFEPRGLAAPAGVMPPLRGW
jgi:hypothetical protein